MKPRVKVKAISRWTAEIIPIDLEPDEVVQALISMLDLAERGEIVSVAVAASHRDGAPATCYCLGRNPGALIGALHIVTDRVAMVFRSDYPEITNGY